MARIRTIKPEFWTSLSVNALSVHARLTFIGLWNYCDDYGRGVDDARLIRAAVWPLDAIAPSKVETWLEEIDAQRLIVRYEVAGKRYLAVPSWDEHQSAAYRRGDPKHPAPPDVLPARQGVQLARHDVLEQGTGNREMEQGTGNRIARHEAERQSPFEAFWTVYPRKVGKRKAQAEYERALRRAEPGIILAGAERYRDDPNREDEFTAHPSTWLHRDGWGDASLPGRSSGEHPLDRAYSHLREVVDGR